ncbi:MAG: hypothetical protein M3O30_17580 [Planctomycetota bacterium]|nr:hypothetical protein [Planctomycetota bacterium]
MPDFVLPLLLIAFACLFSFYLLGIIIRNAVRDGINASELVTRLPPAEAKGSKPATPPTPPLAQAPPRKQPLPLKANAPAFAKRD